MTTAVAPQQILAVGRNYADHAAELGHDVPRSPVLFWKALGSLARDGRVTLPRWSEGPTRVDYEGEVVLVLDRDLGPGTPPLPPDPWDVVRAVCAGVDASDRDLQKLEPQWVRAKSFPGACALSAPVARPRDPQEVRVRTWRNDQQVQDGHARQLIFPFRDLLAWLHGVVRLYAGDVVFTGTPSGVGPLTAGDRLRVEVEGGPGEPVARLELEVVSGAPVPAFERRAWA